MTDTCIQNCWRKARLTVDQQSSESENEDDVDNIADVDAAIDEEPQSPGNQPEDTNEQPEDEKECGELFYEYQNHFEMSHSISFTDYVNADNNVMTTSEATDVEILQEIREDREEHNRSDSDNEGEQQHTEQETEAIPVRCAIEMCEKLHFVVSCPDVRVNTMNRFRFYRRWALCE